MCARSAVLPGVDHQAEYSIEDEPLIILVLRIDHRREVYR